MSSKSTTHKGGGRHPSHVPHKERLGERVGLVLVIIIILLIVGFLVRAIVF